MGAKLRKQIAKGYKNLEKMIGEVTKRGVVVRDVKVWG